MTTTTHPQAASDLRTAQALSGSKYTLGRKMREIVCRADTWEDAAVEFAALARPAPDVTPAGAEVEALRAMLVEMEAAASELLNSLPGHWHDDATIRLTDAAEDARKALERPTGYSPSDDEPNPSASAADGEGLTAYLKRQWGWSKETFGPHLRTKGVIQHITKELREIEANPHDLSEWVDVIILAMDGFWRHGGKPEDLLPAMQAKQGKNFARSWPDWRTMGEDQAIEHDRSGETTPPPAVPATRVEGQTRRGRSCQGMDLTEPYDPLKAAIWAALLPFRNELLETGSVTFMGLRNSIVEAVRSFAIASQRETTAPTLTADGEGLDRASRLNDCCSAAKPCSHQKRDPYSLCEVCEEALAHQTPAPGITIKRIGKDRQGVTVRFAESEYDSEAFRFEEPLPGLVAVLDVDGSILRIDIENLKADMTPPDHQTPAPAGAAVEALKPGQMEFERYPKLASAIQEYASFGRFGDWSTFLHDLNSTLAAIAQGPGAGQARADALNAAIQHALSRDTGGLGWLRDWNEGDKEALDELAAPATAASKRV